MFTVSAMSLLLGSVAPQMRGRAAGFFQGGFLLGGMTGPAIGGLLALISIRAPFFFYAATLAVAGLVGLLLLSRTRVAPAAGAADDAVPLRTVLADPRFQAACLTNLAQGWTSFGVRSALIPVLVVEVLHHNTTWTGIAFACAAVAQTIALAPAGKFVDTVGRRPAMIGGGLLAGCVDHGRAVRTEPGGADRRAVRVRCRRRVPGHRPGRLGGRRDRWRPGAPRWRCSPCAPTPGPSSVRSSPACWPTGSPTRGPSGWGRPCSWWRPRTRCGCRAGCRRPASEPAATAETVPVGEQQIGGPESDDPTTKDLR